MENGSYLIGKMQLARMGFAVVPMGLRHDELGLGMLRMDGDGLRFEPFDKTKEPLALTWEQFDRGKK